MEEKYWGGKKPQENFVIGTDFKLLLLVIFQKQLKQNLMITYTIGSQLILQKQIGHFLEILKS